MKLAMMMCVVLVSCGGDDVYSIDSSCGPSTPIDEIGNCVPDGGALPDAEVAPDAVSFPDAVLPDACDPVLPCDYIAESCEACGYTTWPTDEACYRDRVDFALGCGQCLVITCHWPPVGAIEFCSDPC